MPDNTKEILTGTSAYLALFATAAGCLVRYLEEYQSTKRLSVRWMMLDLLINSIIGYFAFWFMLDTLNFTLSQCAIGTCIAGSYGTRIFDVIRFVGLRKLNVPRSIINDEFSPRNPQQQPRKSSQRKPLGRTKSKAD